MKGSVYIFDRPSGLLLTIRAADVDERGDLIDQALLEELRRGGWSWRTERDLGLAAVRHREAGGRLRLARPAAPYPVMGERDTMSEAGQLDQWPKCPVVPEGVHYSTRCVEGSRTRRSSNTRVGGGTATGGVVPDHPSPGCSMNDSGAETAFLAKHRPAIARAAQRRPGAKHQSWTRSLLAP
jgi:hypothetical protein